MKSNLSTIYFLLWIMFWWCFYLKMYHTQSHLGFLQCDLDVSGAVLSSEQKLRCLISYHVSLGELRSLLKAA